MTFRIYFSDLTFEKQEEIREELKTKWLDALKEEVKENRTKYEDKYKDFSDDEVLNDLYDLMDLDEKELWLKEGGDKKYKEMLKFEVENFAEEKADDEINREFFAQGEI